MAPFEDGTPRRGVEPDAVRELASQLAALRRQVEALGKTASLRNASISGGDGLLVKDGDGNPRLRVSPEEGAILAYNAAGEVVARYGLLAYSDPGEYGIEARDATNQWIHVGDESVTWNNIGGKPATFTPSAHTHGGGDVTSTVANATNAANAALAQQAEGSQYAYDNNVGGTSWYAVYVGNSGGFKFGRNTSSARYKENIRDFTGDVSDLMALRPVVFDRIPQWGAAPVWTDASGVEHPAEGPVQLFPGNKDEFGFIAEEVLEIWPEVVQWFDHGDGLGPQVDGIRYEMIGARLVPILQGMLLNVRTSKRQLVDLAARVTAVADEATAAVLALRGRVRILEDQGTAFRAQLEAQAKLIQDLTTRIEAMP